MITTTAVKITVACRRVNAVVLSFLLAFHFPLSPFISSFTHLLLFSSFFLSFLSLVARESVLLFSTHAQTEINQNVDNSDLGIEGTKSSKQLTIKLLIRLRDAQADLHFCC